MINNHVISNENGFNNPKLHILTARQMTNGLKISIPKKRA